MVRAPMAFRCPGLQRLNAKHLKLNRGFELLKETVLNPQPEEPLKGCRRQASRRDEAFCRSEAEAKAEAKAEAGTEEQDRPFLASRIGGSRSNTEAQLWADRLPPF